MLAVQVSTAMPPFTELFLIIVLFLRQTGSHYVAMAGLEHLCRSGYPQTLCFASQAGIKGVYHQAPLLLELLSFRLSYKIMSFTMCHTSDLFPSPTASTFALFRGCLFITFIQ